MKKIKEKPKTKSYYRNKCDRLLQNIVRLTYDKCLVCGRQISCGHHYFPKSTAGNLRYNLKNIIPICQSCHFRLHNGDPRIQNAINEIKGEEWLCELYALKKQYSKCNTIGYYKNMVKTLELLTPYKV